MEEKKLVLGGVVLLLLASAASIVNLVMTGAGERPPWPVALAAFTLWVVFSAALAVLLSRRGAAINVSDSLILFDPLVAVSFDFAATDHRTLDHWVRQDRRRRRWCRAGSHHLLRWPAMGGAQLKGGAPCFLCLFFLFLLCLRFVSCLLSENRPYMFSFSRSPLQIE